MTITSPAEWWGAVEEHWPHLLEIIYHHMDPNHPAYEVPGQSDSQMTGRNIAVELELLKQQRDERLARYLAAAWCLASDAYAWSVPSWGVLCDLLSEEWALHPEEVA